MTTAGETMTSRVVLPLLRLVEAVEVDPAAGSVGRRGTSPGTVHPVVEVEGMGSAGTADRRWVTPRINFMSLCLKHNFRIFS